MSGLSLRGGRPPIWAGVVTAIGAVALCTGLVYALRPVAPVVSLGVVYLLGVVIVSTYWGLALGVVTSLLSAAAFNFFHLPPTGRFELSDSRDWVALAAFVVVAVATSSASELARQRAAEAERRSAEADLTADMARLLLAGTGVSEVLGPLGHRLSHALAIPWAAIELRERPGDARHEGIPLKSNGEGIATLLVPRGIEDATLARIRTVVVPALEAVLTAALERERLLGEVVETESLRRSDVVKTALLRAVSHDLRSPVTAMVAAAGAIRSPELSEAERDELAAIVVEEGGRLSRLIENLLDLSRLEAGAANPHPRDCAVAELIESARAAQRDPSIFRVAIDVDTPPVAADFGQLERALGNVMENAARYAAGQPVTVRARRTGEHVVLRVTDRGPGLDRAQQARVFEAFYRSAGSRADGHTGSGLGLAIAKGFVEANGGSIRVESVPRQGTTVVIELPAAGSGAEPANRSAGVAT